ncbi:MAG TPA: CBS domain-containing protein [Leptolyngbyaceae cyanobacterium M33_DOE_097]|uniref:CBS domain-containing protein n=1 Tax=Oscillatoriales cyanobacterium SpSt-418 TaxID=2282169 RepID=A0A7C3PTV5_9CYAN|nr:CBS domain-containing protein [Leptolyngbyaceae cyanobacterium M33_DOE_097]
MKALDIMTKDIVTICNSATIAEALDLMKLKGWRSLVVDREDAQDAYGIITETDIACKVIAVGQNPDRVQVCEVMTKPCIVVNPDLSVENVAKLFANNRILGAPVIQGQLLGFVSISDILMKSHLGKKLHHKIPDQHLQHLVQYTHTVETEKNTHLETNVALWNIGEEQLTNLSQHDAEIALNAALEEYSKELAALREPDILDNLCSG